MQRLVDVQTQLNLTLNDCVGLVEQQLTKPVYTKQEICDILGVSVEELNVVSLTERSRTGQSWVHIYWHDEFFDILIYFCLFRILIQRIDQCHVVSTFVYACK